MKSKVLVYKLRWTLCTAQIMLTTSPDSGPGHKQDDLTLTSFFKLSNLELLEKSLWIAIIGKMHQRILPKTRSSFLQGTILIQGTWPKTRSSFLQGTILIRDIA
ncbi:unnamed protein product [Lymnaea stagnalis]|uniref:Uncharacterized protein n=1 Tax=Lymnaea stagnalis TaxID=6523 RepID=A0AAV2HZJ9_LYMST